MKYVFYNTYIDGYVNGVSLQKDPMGDVEYEYGPFLPRMDAHPDGVHLTGTISMSYDSLIPIWDIIVHKIINCKHRDIICVPIINNNINLDSEWIPLIDVMMEAME